MKHKNLYLDLLNVDKVEFNLPPDPFLFCLAIKTDKKKEHLILYLQS